MRKRIHSGEIEHQSYQGIYISLQISLATIYARALTVTLPYIWPFAGVWMKRKVVAGIPHSAVIAAAYFHSSFRKATASYLWNTIRKTSIAMASVQNTSASGNLLGLLSVFM
jgi:hypothetical protein